MLLSVMLWAVPGEERSLAEYEDRVLELLPRHQAELLSRVRSLEGAPCEIQLLRFASEESLESYMEDPTRQGLSRMRERTVARTEVLRVEQVNS